MKKIVSSLLFLLISISLFSQSSKNEYFLTRINFGTSLTYMVNGGTYKTEYEQEELKFHEWVLNFNSSVSLNRFFSVGAQYLSVYFYDSRRNDLEIANIYGLFSDFYFIRAKKINFFGELSLNRGNYANCYNGEPYNIPYKKEGLYYLGYGISISLPILKTNRHFFAEFGFYNYQILNNLEGIDNLTQYIISLNYVL